MNVNINNGIGSINFNCQLGLCYDCAGGCATDPEDLSDLNNLNERFDKLDKHFELAQKDLELAKISQKKVHSRGSKIISIDVEDKSDNKKIIN